MIEYRYMRPEEEIEVEQMLEELNELEEAGYNTHDMPSWPGANESIIGKVLVAESNGEIIGFLMYDTTDINCSILDVYVKENIDLTV